MNRSKLRRQIAWEAARLMYSRQDSEYYTAKMKAARQICKGWVKPADLPSNVEIRDQIEMLARLFEGAACSDNLLAMRLSALAMMRRLAPFRPRLIGSVLTGHVRAGSDIGEQKRFSSFLFFFSSAQRSFNSDTTCGNGAFVAEP